MKLLSNYRPTVPAVATPQNTNRGPDPAPPAACTVPTRRPRLPKDAYVALSSNPTELHVSMTITKIEHIEALMDTLHMYAPQVEYGRRRDDDDR